MNELEDRNFVSSETDPQKILTNKPEEQGTFSQGSQASGNKVLKDILCRSIKTVVFSNKLNLLIPFGPLAILINNLTGSLVRSRSPPSLFNFDRNLLCSFVNLLISNSLLQGWVFFLSLLGITPLAERLGYATE